MKHKPTNGATKLIKGILMGELGYIFGHVTDLTITDYIVLFVLFVFASFSLYFED